jgi:hypothetical protein
MPTEQRTAPLPISLTELRRRVIEHDSSLIAQGSAPHQRPLAVSMAIARELGITWTIGALGADPVTEAVHKIYGELYRVRDLALPPVHVGAFMFRDVFFRVWVPVAYGTVAIRPFDLIDDMSEAQKRWMASEPADLGRFLDQVIDLVDFGYGLDDLSKMHSSEAEAVSLLKLSRAHLEAAANACVGSVDPYAVAQNSLIAIELNFKGALRASGRSERELKDIGHDMLSLGRAFVGAYAKANSPLLLTVCASLPKLVTHRYERLSLSRQQIGDIVMKAQFLGGEVMRQLTDRNIRSAFRMEGSPEAVARVFPA